MVVVTDDLSSVSRFSIQSSEFKIEQRIQLSDLGFGVSGLGPTDDLSSVSRLAFRVLASLAVSSTWCGIQSSGLRVEGLGLRLWGLGFGVLG